MTGMQPAPFRLPAGLGVALFSAALHPAALFGGDCPPPPFLIEHHASMQAGRYAEAEKEARRVVAAVAGAHGADSVPAAQALEALALAISRAGRPMDSEALGAARRALAVKEKLLAPDDPLIADAHSLLGQVLENRSEWRSAKQRHERALEIRERALGPDHPDVADSLYRIAGAAYQLDEDEKALVLLERSVGILEAKLGPDSPEVGSVLALRSRVLTWLERRAEGLAAAERSLRVLERAKGPEHPVLAASLAAGGRALSAAGEPENAERMYRRAVDLVERALGPEHPDLIPLLDLQGGSAFETGEYQAAVALRERLVSILEKTKGSWSTDLAVALNDHGAALWHTGDRVECRRLLERAVEIMASTQEERPATFSYVSQNLALFLLYVGDYDAALPHLHTILKVAERTLEPEHYERVRAMANLAFLFVEMGRFQDALPLAEKVVEIWTRRLGPDNPDLARATNTLAAALGGLGDLERARAVHERALSIWRRRPAEVPDMALDLEGLGKIALRERNAAEAREWFEKASSLRRATQGEEHPDLAVSLEGLGRALWLLGEPARSLDLALRAEAIGRAHLQNAARGLSEREALRYASIRPSGLDLALSVLTEASAAGPSAEATRRVWDQVIRSRAVVLDEIGERHRSVSAGGRGELAALRQELDGARRRLAQLLVTGVGPVGAGRFEREVGAAQAERDRAERALAEKSPAFSESVTRSRAGIEEVVAALPRDSALVAYVLCRRWRGPISSVPGYAAFVVVAGAGEPAFVPMGAADDVDRWVRAWREHGAGRGSEEAYRAGAEALRRAIWEPVAPYVKGVAQVFVVPDGVLNLVNLGTLPAEGGRYLVEAGPVIHYLSAERDLVRPARGRRAQETLLAVGGPDYQAKVRPAGGGGVKMVSAAEAAPAATALGRAAMYRGGSAECEALRRRRFDPLPAAWLEAREVTALWRARSGWAGTGAETSAGVGPASGGPAAAQTGPWLLTGTSADEGTFKRLAPEHSLIHLATHGFFAEGCAPSATRSPLLLSGLALVGANRRGERGAEEGGEDGILTAEEIVSLDLSKADWVVLSACETGLGKLEAGEGVLGLRRAFQVAGARTVIMSLWPVEDAATRTWMKHLYEERLAGASTAEAVRGASLKVIAERRKAGKSVHPSTWGAFVAAGDWR